MRKSIRSIFLSIFNQVANWLILDFRSFFQSTSNVMEISKTWNAKIGKQGCFDNELNLFGANILERMKRFREKRNEKMLEDEWMGKGIVE